MSNNTKFTSYNDVNEVVNELFESILLRYQDSLEISMREKYFIFDSVKLMDYKRQKVNYKRDGSFTDSPDSMKIR